MTGKYRYFIDDYDEELSFAYDPNDDRRKKLEAIYRERDKNLEILRQKFTEMEKKRNE